MQMAEIPRGPQGTLRQDDVDAVIEEARAAGQLEEPIEYLPLVSQHPATGKKSISLSPYLVLDIEGMTPADSRKLAADLVERCWDSHGIYRWVGFVAVGTCGCGCGVGVGVDNGCSVGRLSFFCVHGRDECQHAARTPRAYLMPSCSANAAELRWCS